MVLKEEKQGYCVVHGPQTYLYSNICKSYVCIECIKEQLFIEDVEKEIVTNYPQFFGVADETSNHM